MARSFSGGTNEYLSSSSTIDLSSVNKFTISFWLWWNSFSSDDRIVLETGANYNLSSTDWLIDPNSTADSAGKFSFGHNGDIGRNYYLFTRPSANVWHQYVGLFDKSSSGLEVSAYLNGSVPAGAASGATNVNNTNNFGNSTLNFMGRSGGTLLGTGRLCEVAIWSGILLDTNEITSLSLGYSPLFIRPASLSWYWPMMFKRSPETELVKGNEAVLNATVLNTNHPRIIYPSPVYIPGVSQTVKFRKTLSGIGTKVGSRQVHSWGS